MNPRFLSLDDVLRLHAWQLARYGGGEGIRDIGLLESAVAQPQAGFGGRFAHETIAAMTGAYLFHIVANHPFVDGNKRTGLLAALTFLDLNDLIVMRASVDWYSLTLAVAAGQLNKAEVVARLTEWAGR